MGDEAGAPELASSGGAGEGRARRRPQGDGDRDEERWGAEVGDGGAAGGRWDREKGAARVRRQGPAGPWAAEGAGLAWLLGCRAPSLSLSLILLSKQKIKRKKKGRKERLEKELGTGIIFTDSEKCSRSGKIEKGQV